MRELLEVILKRRVKFFEKNGACEKNTCPILPLRIYLYYLEILKICLDKYYN
ncbi:MAG: hypothetical protein QXI58_06480 [Candidatus Micrarchaeia archaeon]